jgi:APA family basic amino acid/polyamine antiporter
VFTLPAVFAGAVVTVAIPYLFSACAQLTCLVARRRPRQGWQLARDLSITVAATPFSPRVTFAAYSAVPRRGLDRDG